MVILGGSRRPTANAGDFATTLVTIPQVPDSVAERGGFDGMDRLYPLQRCSIGYCAADRWTVARPQGRAAGSWNRRAVIIADREFGQSQEPASGQVVLRKAEPVRQRTTRSRWTSQRCGWEWMYRRTS